MKSILALFFLLIFQFGFPQFHNNREVAKQEALISKKLILVEYYCYGFKPSIKLQEECWDNNGIMDLAKSLVLLRENVNMTYYFDRDNINKRHAHDLNTSIIHILDPNGKIVDNLDYYENQSQIEDLIRVYSFSNDFLSVDLINYNKNANFQNSVTVFQKYLQFSLQVDIKIKSKIISLAFLYLDDADNLLNKEEIDFQQKKQKIQLLYLYNLAYEFKFEKLFKNLKKLSIDEVYLSNRYDYWFLNYLSSKALELDISQLEQNLKKENLEIIITNANPVYNFYLKQKKNNHS